MPKTSSTEIMRKHHQNRAKNDLEFKKKESQRISDLQRQQYASLSEEELSTMQELL